MSTTCHEMDAHGWALFCVFQRQKDGCCSWFRDFLLCLKCPIYLFYLFNRVFHLSGSSWCSLVFAKKRCTLHGVQLKVIKPTMLKQVSRFQLSQPSWNRYSQAMCKLQHGNKWLNAVVLETLPDSKVRIHVQLPCACKQLFFMSMGVWTKCKKEHHPLHLISWYILKVFASGFTLSSFFGTCKFYNFPGALSLAAIQPTM